MAQALQAVTACAGFFVIASGEVESDDILPTVTEVETEVEEGNELSETVPAEFLSGWYRDEAFEGQDTTTQFNNLF